MVKAPRHRVQSDAVHANMQDVDESHGTAHTQGRIRRTDMHKDMNQQLTTRTCHSDTWTDLPVLRFMDPQVRQEDELALS